MQPKPQYQEVNYRAPYGGLNVQAPPTLISPAETPDAQNFILRNKAICSMPWLDTVSFPKVPDGLPIRALLTFQDEWNLRHTIAVTSSNIWQLLYSSTGWKWQIVTNLGTGNNDYPFAVISLLNKAYWTNGLGISVWDGESTVVSEVTSGSVDVNKLDTTKPIYGGYFLGELGYHIIAAYTVEFDPATGSVSSFPHRIRWSASGDPTAWNPANNANAGYNDQFDVPDIITGFITLGKYGFIFRNNGISQMSLTGNGQVPFYFDHLWAAREGIGNILPTSIASYGSVAIFVSSEQIYSMSVGGFTPIGGNARDAIFADIDDCITAPVSFMVAGHKCRSPFFTYNLAIPVTGGTKLWMYHIEDKNWTRQFLPGFYFTAAASSVFVR